MQIATDSKHSHGMTVIHEHVYIEAPYVQAVGAFERRLGLEPGAAEGTSKLSLVFPFAEGRQIARDVTATTTRASDGTMFRSRYRIAWPAGNTAAGLPTPAFEGTVTLRAGEDYTETELELDGQYQPPGGVAGKMFDEIAGRRIAHATLGSLLEGVRDELRAAHENIETAKRAESRAGPLERAGQ